RNSVIIPAANRRETTAASNVIILATSDGRFGGVCTYPVIYSTPNNTVARIGSYAAEISTGDRARDRVASNLIGHSAADRTVISGNQVAQTATAPAANHCPHDPSRHRIETGSSYKVHRVERCSFQSWPSLVVDS